MTEALRGFILDPTYRLESGRPVVHLYGKLEDGRSFLVRDGRQSPYFYVRASDADRARGKGARPLAPAARRTLAGEPVARVEVAAPADAPRLRQRLMDAGIPCYEADVRFAMRYLIDRGIRGALSIHGEAHPEKGIEAVWDEPELFPARFVPNLSILSLDIETDPRAERLLSVALVGERACEVLLLTEAGQECPPGATPCASERELLEWMVTRIRALDPDVLTGWNVVDFDLKVLQRIALRHRIALELGRGLGAIRFQSTGSAWGASHASIPGRAVLDGLHLLRGAFVRVEDHTLDAVAREILGEGKTMAGPGRARHILEAWEKDRAKLVAYNQNDARLVLGIIDKLHLLDLAVERSLLTGMPLHRVAASIASFDFVYLSELGRRGVVAPTVSSSEADLPPTTGGYVLEPAAGLYENVLVLDFKSLYPSIIRTFHIDPLGFMEHPSPDADPVVAPNGAAFRRGGGILPHLIEELFERRERAKAERDEVRSHAIKILMNSFYGVLGTPACRFHNPDIANAITSFGREVLLFTKGRIESRGYTVLYGDTDSLFVLSRKERVEEARALGVELLSTLNDDLARHVMERWRVESRLELEYDTLYLKLHLPPMRHGAGGARKRYVGLVEEGGKRKVVFTGMEAVRRDWTDLAKQVQRELYERLFEGKPLDEYVRAVVADLRAGKLDKLLVYRKALRKDAASYTATTPPHVAAARQMAASAKGGKVIAYVMTQSGPEPAGRRASPIDHEHYVQKQVRAVAEPVLALSRLDFDRVVGDDRQLSLF